MTKVQNMFKDMHKLLMALILGNIVGAATCGFFALVQMALAVWKLPIPQTIVSFDEVQYSTTLAMFMLGGGLLAGVIFSRLEGPRSHGPGDLMLAIHKDHDPDLKGGFLTSALTLVSVSSGASVGVFGPIIHYGGCIATWLKQFFSNLSRPVILASGGAAAIGALFSAPIAAAIFAHEMLLRRVRTSESAPVVMAALGGYFSAVMLLGDNRRFLNVVGDPLPFSPFALGMAVAVGICCGLVSSLYIYLVTSGPGWAKQSKIPPILRPLVAAAILFAISPFFPQLIGPGMPSVNMAIAGKFSLVLLVCLVFLKVCATAMCRSLGFHGGIFLPAVFIGAMIGGIFDLLVGEGSHMFALLGAAACTGSAIGAPIAAVVILFEMSGDYRFIVLAMVSVAISCQISRSLVARSIWDRGLLLRGFDLDKEAEEIYRKHHSDKS
ncbi:MAG: chloride channel protein [Burkholderiales bacterium]|nr:chloride channel protein [Burkholderiales bacterium]